MSIGNIVLKRMKELGLTKACVSSHLRIDQKLFSMWISGKKSLPLKTVWMLFTFLNLPKSVWMEIL